MRILVIGGSGFLGSHLIKDLSSNKKFHVTSISRGFPIKDEKLESVNYINIDVLNDFNSLKEQLNKSKIIINLIGELKKESYMYETNFLFVKKIVDYIISSNLNLYLIQISSVGVYGARNKKNKKINFVNEKSKMNPHNVYEKTKRDADHYILKKFRKTNKSFYVILRPTTVVGKKMNSKVLKKIKWLVKNKLFIYFGYDNFFNFIHVQDLISAVNLCIDKISLIKNKTYIISNDSKQINVINKIALLCKVKRPSISINLKIILFIFNLVSFFKINFPNKLNNLQFWSSRVVFSNKKITKDLNFNPSYSLEKKKILKELLENL